MLQLSKIEISKEGKEILRDIDLTVNQGEKVVILGDSGSGKSTLLKSIILFERISSGKVIYKGKVIDASNVDFYRRDFVYIAQKAPQSFSLVKDYICLPFQFARNSSNIPGSDIIKEHLNRLNFPDDILNQSYNDLSGGEQQRITIIQAFLLSKSVYLLDEITSNLDRENVRRVIDLILSDDDRTIIYVTHDTEHLDRFDSVYRLVMGSLRKEVNR